MEKNSVELHNYDSTPVYDSHIHNMVSRPIDETIWCFENVMKHFNYKKIALNGLPTYNYADNWVAFYCKSQIPEVYVNAGLYHIDGCNDADCFYKQVKAYHEMGCDGIKMIEGKPDSRKEIGLALDCEEYCRAYKYMEENGIPLLFHVNDPRNNWDWEAASETARRKGWVYDESFPTYDKIREEAVSVAEKFPNLTIIFAHFFFVSDDLDYAEKLLSEHKNIYLDITSGTEMFMNFSNNHEKAREFFVKYSDRILYGTDMYNWHKDGDSYEKSSARAVNLERTFLEKSEQFTSPWTELTYDNPFALGKPELDNIYRNNFVKIYGNKPRALNRDRIVAGAKQYLEVDVSKYIIKDDVTEVDIENVKVIIERMEGNR